MLSQEIDGHERVVAYFSVVLEDAAQRYCAFDRELYAIVADIRKFKHYLVGSHFTVYTDHKPLLSFRTMSIDRFADPYHRRSRWISEIGPLDFEILHKAGTKNTNADQLSRHPDTVSKAIAMAQANAPPHRVASVDFGDI